MVRQIGTGQRIGRRRWRDGMTMSQTSTACALTTHPWRGRLLVALAALLWSTSGLFAKAPLFEAWPVETAGFPVRGPLLAFWRAAFACLILVPFVRRPRWTPRLIPMTLAYVAMNYTFLNALTLTNEANAIWLQYTAPLWVFLVGVGVFGEPVHPRDRWLLFGCVLGVGLILSYELRGQSLWGVFFGVMSGLFFAAIVLSLRRLRHEDGAWLMLVNNGVTALVFLPLVIHYGLWPTGVQTLALAGFGMFQMGLPYLLFARGLRSVVGHEASGIVLLEPILVPVWVFLAWRHAPTYQAPHWWTLVGGACILVGLAWRYFGPAARASRAQR